MPTLDKPGARLAAAGAAAATLALAAGSPAFAQTDYEYAAAYFQFDGDTERATVLEEEGQTGFVAIEGPDATQGDLIEITIDFTAAPGIIELTPDDSRCGFSADVLTCTDDGTHSISGTFFGLAFGLGENGAPGSVAQYTLTATVNGTVEDTWTDELTVSEDFKAAEDEDDGEIEPTDPPVEEDPNEVEDGTEYEFALLNYILEGANPGETLTGFPQVRVGSTPAEDRAATVLWFEDSSDVDAWFEDGTIVYTEAVEAIADYDNCQRIEYTVYCVLTDFDPQVGSTYTASEDTPVLYEVLKAVTDADGAAYGAYDINQEGLDTLLADGLAPESDNRLRLVETDMDIEDKYFSEVWGFVFFAGDERGHGDVPPANGGETLPTTGNSSVVMVSAAAAAIAAGAVVFFVMRRRKTAASWE